MPLQSINWNAPHNSIAQSAQRDVQQKQQLQNAFIEQGMTISDAFQKAGNPFQPTATELREKYLREATERAKARLGSGQEFVEETNLQIADRLQGLSEEEIQAKAQSRSEVRAMSDDERVDNWFRLKQNDPTAKDDPTLQTAIDSDDWAKVRLSFSDKPKTLQVIEDARKAKIATVQTRNLVADDGENHSELFSLDNLRANFAGGIAETTSAFEGFNNYLTKDGKERLEAFHDPNSITNQLLSLDWGNASHHLAKLKSSAINDTATQVYDKTKAQAQKENYSEDEVKYLANKASQSAYWEHVFQNKQGITSEMVENIPDVLSAIGSAGVVALVKKGGIKAVEKFIAKKLAETNLKRETSKQLSQEALESTTAKLTERATKNAIKTAKPITTSVITAKEAIETGLTNAPEGYNNASQAILDMDINVLKNTKGFQDLKAQNPNSSDEDIKKLLADKAGSKAYKDVGVATSLTGVLSGIAEGKLVSKLSLGGKGSVKKYGSSVGLSTVGEGAEEYAVAKQSNEAIKDTVGLNTDTEKGAVEAGILGALAGGGTTAISNIPELGNIAKTSVNKTTKGLAKAINKVNERNAKAQAEAEIETHYRTSQTNADTFTSKSKEYEEAFKGINDDSGRYTDEDKQRFEDILSERDEAIIKNRKANDAYQQEAFERTPEGQRSKTIFQEAKDAVDHLNSLVNDPNATDKDKIDAVNKVNSLKQELSIVQAAAQKHYEDFNSRPEIDFWNKQDTREELRDAEIINNAQNQFEFDDNNIGSSKRTKATTVQQQFDYVDKQKDLSANDKKRIKTKIAKNFIKAVREINTEEKVNTGNIYDKWNDAYQSATNALKLLNDKDLHLEPNEKNLIVKGLQHIQTEATRIADIKPEYKPTSAKASLTSFEKLIGSVNRRVRADGSTTKMRGLLDYIQSALNNKGKLPLEDLAQLLQFNLTQYGKYQEVKRIIDEYNAYTHGSAPTLDVKNLLNNKPIKISNPYLKESNETIKQDATAEDREATTISNHKMLKNYYRALEREITSTTDLLTTLAEIQSKKSTKVSGSKATKVTQATRIKESTKEEKKDLEPKQESFTFSDDIGGNSKVTYTNESRTSNLNDTVKPWADDFLRLVKLPENFNFTEQQWNALYQVAAAILSGESSIALSGYAGTGKTTVIKYLVDYLTKMQGGTVAYSAPTHKAVETLAKSTGRDDVKTINSMMSAYNRTRSDRDLGNIIKTDLLVVDEASMLSKDQVETLRASSALNNASVIFMGDPAQLPEVSNSSSVTVSEAFNPSVHSIIELTDVKRANHQEITQFANSIRVLGSVSKLSLPKETEHLHLMQDKDTLINNAVSDLQARPEESTMVIAYKNADVAEYNKAIRGKLLNVSEPSKEPLRLGEQIVGYGGSGYKKPNGNIANSISYKVNEIELGSDVVKLIVEHDGKTNPAYYIPLSTDDVIHIDGFTNNPELLKEAKKSILKQLGNDLASLLSAPKDVYLQSAVEKINAYKDKFSFGNNYLLIPSKDGIEFALATKSNEERLTEVLNKAGLNPRYHSAFRIGKGVDFGYAITAHKSQGATIDNVYADANALPNKEVVKYDGSKTTEGVNMLYVMVSRARNKLSMLGLTKRTNNTSEDINYGKNKHSLSNFTPRSFYLFGHKFESVEHAYQTLKSKSTQELASYNKNGIPVDVASVIDSVAENYRSGETSRILAVNKKFNKVNKQPAVSNEAALNRFGITNGMSVNELVMFRAMTASMNQNRDAYYNIKDALTNGTKFTHSVPDSFWAKRFPELLTNAGRLVISGQYDNNAKLRASLQYIGNKYLEKDLDKMRRANKIIAIGSENSSTDKYSKAWLETKGKDTVNSLNYSSTDKVFISVNGNRRDRISINNTPQLRAMVQSAIDAGATIIIDKQEDRNRSYNIGEKEVAKYLTDNGYNEIGSTGVFTKQITNKKPVVQKPIEKAPEEKQEPAKTTDTVTGSKIEIDSAKTDTTSLDKLSTETLTDAVTKGNNIVSTKPSGKYIWAKKPAAGLLDFRSPFKTNHEYMHWILTGKTLDGKEFEKDRANSIRKVLKANAGKNIAVVANKTDFISYADVLDFLMNNDKSPLNTAIKTNVLKDLSLQELVNIWSIATGSHIESLIDEELLGEYRLKGLDVRIENGKPVIKNALSNPDFKIQDKSKVLDIVEENALVQTNSIKGITEAIFNKNSKEIDTSDEDFRGSFNYLNGFGLIVRSLRTYLESSSKPALEGADNAKSFMSGLFNFVTVNNTDNGLEMGYTADLVVAMARTLSQGITSSRSTGRGKDIRKQYTDDGQKDLYILNISDVPALSIKSSQTEAFEGVHAGSNKIKFKTKVKAVAVSDSNLANLGTEKNKFVRELGESVLKDLGVRIKNDSQDQILYNGMAMAIGVQLLDFLVDSKLVDVNRLFIYPSTGEFKATDMVTVDHISFKMDKHYALSGRYKDFVKKEMSASEAHTSIQTLDIDSNNSKGNILYKAMALMEKYKDTTAGKFIEPETNKDIHGYSREKPFETTDKLNANKLSTGKNRNQQAITQAHNDIEYRVASTEDEKGIYEFLSPDNEDNRNFYKRFIGYNLEDDFKNITAYTKEVKNSINAGIDRSFDILDRTIYKDDKSLPIYLKHKALASLRTFVSSILTPQGDKTHRLLVIPKQKDNTWGFDATGMTSENIASKMLNALNNPQDYSRDEWVIFTGYGIALAQGLDVKVSKLSEEESLNKLQKILSEESVKSVIKELASAIKEGKSPNRELIDVLNSNYKTPLGFNALFTLAQLDAGVSRISDGKFQPLISLEADGVGNGIYNGVKQFVSKLTSEYFSILKRTGNVLMDNLSAKINNLEDMSKIAGSKELFTEDETGKLADVYEVVSTKISANVSKVFTDTAKLNRAMANFADVPFAKVIFDKKDGKTNLENLEEWAYKTRAEAIDRNNVPLIDVTNDVLNFASAARALGLILLTGNADSSLFTKPLKDINSFEIKRALAKLGVTPENYGGRVDGVTNQVVKGVKDSLLNRYNALLEEANKSNEITDAVKRQYKSLSLALSLVGLELPLDKDFTLEELRSYLTNFEGFNIKQSRIINYNVKHSLGIVMDESIQEVYSVQFDNVAALTTLDNILFNNFLLEFNDRLRNFIKARNFKNGWVDKSGKILDPRANDFVTGKELKFDILSNMTNSPQVATAMSDNSQLVNDLIHTGNTILNQAVTTENSNKTSVYGLTQNARLNQFISSTIHGQWQSYTSAGASLLISSLVATESRTMGELIQALAKEGISLTEVFDGVEIPPHLREKVANLLNEITDKIHSEHSLMDAYYHKANRSNIQAIFNEPLTEETKGLIEEYLDTNKLRLNAQLLTLMQTAISSDQVVNKLNSVVIGLPHIGNTESRLRSSFSKALDRITKGETIVEVGGFIPKTVNEEQNFRIFMSLLLADPTAIADYAITALEALRNAAATNIAIKKIETDYLPSKVNQFAGISDGFNKNQDNPKAQATFERFIEFSKTTDDLMFKNNSNALMAFIEQDEIIQKEIAYTKAKYIKANPLAQVSESLSSSYESKPLDEAINDFDVEGSTNVGNTFKLLKSSILKAIKGKGLSHFTNKETFINALSKHIEMTDALRAEIEGSLAYYHPKLGVYTTSKVDTSDFLHELVHAILNDFIRTFVASQHGYNNELNQDQTNAMKLMNKVMLDVINAFTYDSSVIDLLDKITQNGQFDVNYSFSQTHSAFKAATANMLYVRSDEFIKNNSPETVIAGQIKAMQEFFAYSLSEHDALAHLQYHGIKGRAKFLSESGIQTTLDKFKNLLYKVMQSFLGLFGIKYGKFTESYLSDLNRAISILSQTPNVSSSNGSSKVSPDFSFITGSSNITSKHAEFLNDIVAEAQSNFNILKEYDYQDEYKLIQDGLTKDSDSVLNKLRTSTTIPFSQAEEEAFILMNKVFEATNQANDFFGRNSSDVLKHAVDHIDAKSFNKEFGSNAYNQVFNSLEPNELLALMVTNERIKDYVEAIPTTKDYKAKINDAINNLRYDRNISTVSDSALENLGRLGASLNFKDKLSKSQEYVIKLDNLKERVAKQNTIDLARDIAKKVPNDKLSALIYAAGTEYVSGNPRFSEDGDLGSAIQTWLNNRVINRDKNDIINSIIRLFKGVYSKTQHIYQAQNVQSIIVDNAREKVGNAINGIIKETFKNELTEAQDKAMSSILLKGTFARLSAKTYGKADLLGLLNNKSNRDHTLNTLRSDLNKALKGQFTSKELIDEAIDYIEWQTSGLAEKLYKGISKANGAKSYIATNAKVIANGGGIIDMHAISPIIEPIIKEMVAIKGLEHADTIDIKELSDLINNDFNGVKHVINEQQELERVQADSYEYNEAFGIDGYVHSRKNPFKDYKILDPKSETDAKTIKRLIVLGYKPKARLSNGLVVFHNYNATVKNFSVGMFGINESSKLGMANNGNLINSGGKSVKTKDIGLDYFRTNIKGKPNAYTSLQDDSNSHIVVTTSGSYEITDLPKYLKDQLVEENEAGYESIGNYYARLVAERRTVAENKKNVDLLNKHYSTETDKRRFAHVTKDSKGIFKEFYNSLPKTTRDYIDSVGGVYVDKYEANNIIGLRAVNFTDILLEDGDFLPKPIKQAIRLTVNAVTKDMLGIEPAIALNYLERGLKEVTSLAKDFVLVRSIIVPMQNLVSNVIHLGMQGVPVRMIPALMHEGYIEAKNYNKLQSEFVGINHRLSLPNLSKAYKDKLNARKKVIQSALERNPVRPLIQAGILTSISDLSKETTKEDNPYSLLNKLGNKTGVLPLRESLPTPVKNLMMMKGSASHNLMSDTMDFGDFVAKYVLYKHLRNNKKYAHTDAINVIREEFINYSTNKGAIYDILNATGMLWFTNYKFAIQKVIYNNWKNNTLRTLAVLTGEKGIQSAEVPVVSDLVQTVPSQIFWTDYSGYHFQASNIIESFGSHWLTKLLSD